MTRSSMVMITPPWVAPQLFRSSGRFLSETTACSFVISTSWMPRCSVKGILMPAAPGVVEAPSGDTRASIDCDDLPGDVARGVRGEQDHEPLQVLRVTEPAQRRARDDLLAEPLERRLRHLRRKESRRDGVHRDAVLAPFGGGRAREIHQAPLGRVYSSVSGHVNGIAAHPAVHAAFV